VDVKASLRPGPWPKYLVSPVIYALESRIRTTAMILRRVQVLQASTRTCKITFPSMPNRLDVACPAQVSLILTSPRPTSTALNSSFQHQKIAQRYDVARELFQASTTIVASASAKWSSARRPVTANMPLFHITNPDPGA
jgi:hypothetical protein